MPKKTQVSAAFLAVALTASACGGTSEAEAEQAALLDELEAQVEELTAEAEAAQEAAAATTTTAAPETTTTAAEAETTTTTEEEVVEEADPADDKDEDNGEDGEAEGSSAADAPSGDVLASSLDIDHRSDGSTSTRDTSKYGCNTITDTLSDELFIRIMLRLGHVVSNQRSQQ